MPLGVSSVQWDMRIARGGGVSWAFSVFKAGGIEPYNIAGHTFEWLVKAQPSDVSPLIKLTTDGSPTPTGAGTLTTLIQPLLSSVILALTQTATSALTAPFQGYHALWMDYADPSSARNLFWGQFYLDPAPQPQGA